jgi:hypothetical protein
VRIDQGAVEVQKNGASHDAKIAVKGSEYNFAWFRFCFGSSRIERNVSPGSG